MSISLTADMCAVAVVASARSYGDDPLRALAAKRGPSRRCLSPATRALAEYAGIPGPRVCAILGVSLAAITTAPSLKAGYSTAWQAAIAALEAGFGPSDPITAPSAERPRRKKSPPPPAWRRFPRPLRWAA